MKIVHVKVLESTSTKELVAIQEHLSRFNKRDYRFLVTGPGFDINQLSESETEMLLSRLQLRPLSDLPNIIDKPEGGAHER